MRVEGSVSGFRTEDLRSVPIGTVLNLGTTTSHVCEEVPRRARISGS